MAKPLMDHGRYELAYGKVDFEIVEATRKHGPFNSMQEGWAVIQEEVDELRDSIRQHHHPTIIEAEAVQVAAMAIRFIHDLPGMEEGR